MGDLSRISLAELVHAHGIDTIVETGTGHGYSIAAALRIPAIKFIVSIEIDPETFVRERQHFSEHERVRIVNGDSVEAIPRICKILGVTERRVLWFLDAHFPGSGRHRPVPMIVAGDRTVPIAKEIDALLEHRNLEHDVIVVDDLCMFEIGSYEFDAPEFRKALRPGLLKRLDTALRETHDITRLMRDGGYLIARPKPAYRPPS